MNRELVAIYFMIKRELIRFLRSKSRIIGSLGMPFFLLAIMGTGLNGIISTPNANGNYLDFIAPGIIAMVLLFGSMFCGVTVIMDRQFGFLKETLVAPIKRTSIVLGKSLGGAITAIIQGLLILIIALLLGVHLEFSNIIFVIFLMGLISITFVALGIALASTMEDMHGFQLIMNFLLMPMFFLSGALFPLDSAPEILRYISYIDPLTYAVEALRYFLIGYSPIPIFISIGILSAFLVIAVYFAVYLFNRIEN
ncbi:MAG: ABC transporter permease [Candidatus Micrarchaeia archaeon]